MAIPAPDSTINSVIVFERVKVIIAMALALILNILGVIPLWVM